MNQPDPDGIASQRAAAPLDRGALLKELAQLFLTSGATDEIVQLAMESFQPLATQRDEVQKALVEAAALLTDFWRRDPQTAPPELASILPWAVEPLTESLKRNAGAEPLLTVCFTVVALHNYLEHTDEAIRWSRQALDFTAPPSLQHKMIEVRVDLARLLKTKDQRLEAKRVLNEGLDTLKVLPIPTSPAFEEARKELLLDAAILAHGLQDFRRGAVLYEQLCIPANEGSTTYWMSKMGLGICLAELKQYESGIQHLEQVRSGAPESIQEETLFSLQRMRFARATDVKRPSIQAAIDELRSLLTEGIMDDVLKYDTQWALADALQQAGETNYEEAINLLAPLVDSPVSPETRDRVKWRWQVLRYEKANRDYRNGLNAAAVTELEALRQGGVSNNEFQANILTTLVYALFNLKRYVEAMKYVHETLALPGITEDQRMAAMNIKRAIEERLTSGS